MKKKRIRKISAEELDAKFERGEDVSDYMDWKSASKQVRIEMPVRTIKKLRELEKRQGITFDKLVNLAVDNFLVSYKGMKLVSITDKDLEETVKILQKNHKKALDELK